MPQSRIEIEELGPGRWVAEVEAGGTSARRRRVTAATFDEIVMAVVEAHAEFTAPPTVKVPAVVEALGDDPLPSYQPEPRDKLIAEAEALGLAIDRRWGDARLREVVEAARGGANPD